MRLLVALPPLEDYSPATGGAVATVVEALSRHWIADGHEVVVLGAPGPDPYRTGTLVPLRYRWPEPSRLRRTGLGILRRIHKYDWPAYAAYVSDVRRALRAHRPDWLLLHNDAILPSVLRPADRRTARVGLTLHNSVHTQRPDRALETLKNVSVLTAVSRFIAEETAARYPVAAGRVSVINNGVDNELYSGAMRPCGPALRVAFTRSEDGPEAVLQPLIDDGVVTLHRMPALPRVHWPAALGQGPATACRRGGATAKGGHSRRAHRRRLSELRQGGEPGGGTVCRGSTKPHR